MDYLKVIFLILSYHFLCQLHCTTLPVFTKPPQINITSDLPIKPSKNVCCSCLETPSNETKVIHKRPKTEVYRLPKTIVPIEYNLSLEIDFLSFQKKHFQESIGNVSITIKVKSKKVDFIVLHCDDNISLTSIRITYIKDKEKKTNLVKTFTHFNNLNITLKSYLSEGETYIIDIFNFTIRYFLNDDSGILTRVFDDVNRSNDYILATQLEPESARKIFPCFDEPYFKAVFNLKIMTNSEFNILTNTIDIGCQTKEGWKTCIFEPTPVMSTYNLAFSINNFKYVEHIDSRNLVYRVWTRKSQIKNAVAALNYTVQIFKIFEDLFRIAFPLQKVDSLAIPNLRGFLGMEHFGLITYDESVLVQDERFPMTFSRQLCVLIICHEVSHQWFGNIVTTAWWQDLWLNEGFATYYSFRIAAEVLGDEEFYPIEKLAMINYVKHMDDYYFRPGSTMNYPVVDKAELKFDYLSYKKGFIIISMLEEIMTRPSFDLSLREYLKDYKYQAVYPAQLWKTTNKFYNGDLEDIMGNWISKIFYPMVTVFISVDSSLVVDQRSSINTSSSIPFISKDYLTNQWILPLFIVYGNETFRSEMSLFIFNRSYGTPAVTGFNSRDHWIIVNHDYVSLFTVEYDDNIIKNLINTLLINHTNISPKSRAHILQDFYDSSKERSQDNFKRMFKMLTYIRNETHPIPLITAINILDRLNGLLELRSFYMSWYKYVTNILEPSLERLLADFSQDFLNSNSTHVILRRSLLNIACKLKLPYCQKITDKIIERWNNNTLLDFDFDLLHIALCQYIQKDELGEIWASIYKSKIFQSWDFISVKYYAMGCSKVPWVIEKNIDIALNVLHGSSDRQDVPHVSSLDIDDKPSDSLRGITSLSNILIISSIYNNPNFQMNLIRFIRSGLSLICNTVIYEPYFPIPKSIIEYAIPTMSHYRFAKQIYVYHNYVKDTFLLDAKSNLDWMQHSPKIEVYLSKYL